jgi:ribose transport system ATP-binding protein
MATPDEGLRLDGLSIGFDDVQALDDVSLHFPSGAITALLGENGSGKSTIVKTLAGIYAPDEGMMSLAGKAISLPLTPGRSQALGIGIMHQDLGLIETMSIADNIALGAGFSTPSLGFVSRRKLWAMAQAWLLRVGSGLDPELPISALSMRDRTIVALARMLATTDKGATVRKTIILDEPTASLVPDDAMEIYKAARHMAEAGATVVLITHHLEDVIAVASSVVVLRRGKVVAERQTAELSIADLAEMIVGSRLSAGETISGAAALPSADTALEIEALSGAQLDQLTFRLLPGEILGISGLRSGGAGTLVDILSGITTATSGAVIASGKVLQTGSPERMVAAGVVTVPEDRKQRGVHLGFSIAENIALSRFVRGRARRFVPALPSHDVAPAKKWIEAMDIRPPDGRTLAGKLSGGNQQKVSLARALELAPRVLVLDEPTQGVDVGAQVAIHRQVREFAENGGAVILFSTNHDEIVSLCNRVLVLHRGRLVDTISGDAMSRGRLAHAATTGTPTAVTPAALLSTPL